MNVGSKVTSQLAVSLPTANIRKQFHNVAICKIYKYPDKGISILSNLIIVGDAMAVSTESSINV